MFPEYNFIMIIFLIYIFCRIKLGEDFKDTHLYLQQTLICGFIVMPLVWITDCRWYYMWVWRYYCVFNIWEDLFKIDIMYSVLGRTWRWRYPDLICSLLRCFKYKLGSLRRDRTVWAISLWDSFDRDFNRFMYEAEFTTVRWCSQETASPSLF